MHPTIATINLEAIKHNVRRFKAHIGKQTMFCAVLKADGYGHGALPAARAALAAGADWLATAFIPEALELRYAGITAPILVLGYLPPEDYHLAIENNLTVTLMTTQCAKMLDAAARQLRRTIDVHIKLNTGMNRIGVHYSQAAKFAAELAELPNLRVTGIYSHFARADEPDLSYSKLQAQRFNSALAEIKQRGMDCGIRHLCNSAGTLALPSVHLDMVRVGISLYGLYPSPECARSVALKPAMQLRSVVSQIIEHAPGEPISYGGTYRTERNTVLAVIPVGYADGYMRCLTNNAEALLHGKRIRQVGRICMDQCMFDITGIGNVNIGDEILLFGDNLPVDELAQKAGTINYEMCCAVSKRVSREYV